MWNQIPTVCLQAGTKIEHFEHSLCMYVRAFVCVCVWVFVWVCVCECVCVCVCCCTNIEQQRFQSQGSKGRLSRGNRSKTQVNICPFKTEANRFLVLLLNFDVKIEAHRIYILHMLHIFQILRIFHYVTFDSRFTMFQNRSKQIFFPWQELRWKVGEKFYGVNT